MIPVSPGVPVGNIDRLFRTVTGVRGGSMGILIYWVIWDIAEEERRGMGSFPRQKEH